MNVLVTGGTGYVGMNLVKVLLKENYKVFLLRRESSKNEITHPNLIEIFYDGTYSSLEKIQEKIDVIYHLAAYFVVEHTEKDIDIYINSNILLGTHILEFMRKNGIKNIINTESYSQNIYGAEYQAQNLYAATKQAFVDILKYYVDDYGLRAISLVLSDTYGPNDTRNKFFNLVLKSISTEDKIFKMSLGEQEICYIYIDDVINAYMKATEVLNKLNDGVFKRYTVFGDEIFQLYYVAKKIEKIYGVNLKIERGYYQYRKREIMKFTYPRLPLPDWKANVKLDEGIKLIKDEKKNIVYDY